jgi:DNA-binding MarR family transcriptional regulator
MIPKGKIDNLSELITEIGKKFRDMHRDNPIIPISHVSLHTLKFIAEKKNPTMKELADHLYITPPSVTAIIEPLAEERYLLREPDKTDRRIIRLTLTQKGSELLNKCLLLARKEIKAVLDKMDEEEVDNLCSGLAHLLKIMKNK